MAHPKMSAIEYARLMKKCIDACSKEELLTIPEVYQAVSKRLHSTVLEMWAEEERNDKIRKEWFQ